MFMRKISSKMCEHISNLYTVKQYNDGNRECKYCCLRGKYCWAGWALARGGFKVLIDSKDSGLPQV